MHQAGSYEVSRRLTYLHDCRIPSNGWVMAELAPPHAGLVREDMILLNYIFGLPLDSCLQSPLQSPISLPELVNTTIKDVVLVALDTEVSLFQQGDIEQVKRLQVGVSIFDIRSVLRVPFAAQGSSIFEQQTANALQTFNLCSGGVGYCAKASRRFLFGESERVSLDQIRPKLEELVAKDRHIVLVVHGGYQDLSFLREMEIDVRPVCTIDTQKAAQTALRLARRYSLEQHLDALSCPFKNLHIAGNEANFTMRALFMIAVKGAQDTAPKDPQQKLLSTLQAIAQSTRFNSGTWLDSSKEEAWLEAQDRKYGTLEERQAKNRRKKAKKRGKKRN